MHNDGACAPHCSAGGPESVLVRRQDTSDTPGPLQCGPSGRLASAAPPSTAWTAPQEQAVPFGCARDLRTLCAPGPRCLPASAHTPLALYAKTDQAAWHLCAQCCIHFAQTRLARCQKCCYAMDPEPAYHSFVHAPAWCCLYFILIIIKVVPHQACDRTEPAAIGPGDRRCRARTQALRAGGAQPGALGPVPRRGGSAARAAAPAAGRGHGARRGAPPPCSPSPVGQALPRTGRGRAPSAYRARKACAFD